MDEDKMVSVSWFDCSCPWITNYCEEMHQRTTQVPLKVLLQYVIVKEGS